MNLTHLNDIVSFTLGKNPSRINDTDVDMYTQEDFEKDLNSNNYTISTSECIINLIRSKAAPCSKMNQKKCISSNFIKCAFNEKKIDPWYFCYAFNEGKELEQQINMYNQGTSAFVKKLNIKIIGELQLSLPSMDKQKVIGEMYKGMLKNNSLLLKQAEDIKKLTIAVIRKVEED